MLETALALTTYQYPVMSPWDGSHADHKSLLDKERLKVRPLLVSLENKFENKFENNFINYIFVIGQHALLMIKVIGVFYSDREDSGARV